MAHEQTRDKGKGPKEKQQKKPIMYGDVFLVSEKIANKPIGPKDAAAMQSAEKEVLGLIRRGGPAAIMQSAAAKNVRAGIFPPGTATDIGKKEGMRVTEFIVGGRRIITESIGDQVVACYEVPDPNPSQGLDKMDRGTVTIGDNPIDESDATAIEKAEMLAIYNNSNPPGGQHKTILGDALTDARAKLKGDKAVNLRDAERAIAAEIRNSPHMVTNLGGVGESVAAVARLNQ